jgi:hypothetical protein
VANLESCLRFDVKWNRGKDDFAAIEIDLCIRTLAFELNHQIRFLFVIVKEKGNLCHVLSWLVGIESNSDKRLATWLEDSFHWVHSKHFASFQNFTVDSPRNRPAWVWVLDLDVLVERQWFLALRNYLRLKVDDCWLNKEPGFYSYSLNSTL